MTRKVATEVRREQIVDAALEQIAQDGVRGLTIAAVAGRVGLVPSAIYRHFSGKEEILDAVLDRIGERLDALLARTEQGPGGALDALRRLLDAHLRLVRDHPGIPRLVFSGEVQDGERGRRLRLLRLIEGYLEGVAEIARRGREQGELRQDLDPEDVARAFLGMIQPGVLLWHLSEGGHDIERHGRRAWRLFAEQIRAGA